MKEFDEKASQDACSEYVGMAFGAVNDKALARLAWDYGARWQHSQMKSQLAKTESERVRLLMAEVESWKKRDEVNAEVYAERMKKIWSQQDEITALKAELDTAQTDYADEMTITSQLHDKVAVLVKERNALKEKLALAVEGYWKIAKALPFTTVGDMRDIACETLAKLEGQSE